MKEAGACETATQVMQQHKFNVEVLAPGAYSGRCFGGQTPYFPLGFFLIC